jgi:hypothetical protein
MQTPSVDKLLETLQIAAEENKLTALRQFQVLHLPAEGEVWMTGDIHDNRTNFDKLIRGADLANHPRRHLVFHELIHGDHLDPNGAEDSWKMLYQAAELKCDFPFQVHFLLANHDLAQVQGEGIMKSGMSVCGAFNAGIKRDFNTDTTSVQVAITDFLLSSPLAIRCPNGLFFSHSIPAEDQVANFDYSVFDRPLTPVDYKRRIGPVYQLVWGRNVTPAGVELFAHKVGAEIIVTGHQPQEAGFSVNGPRHLILASEHPQGVFLPIDLSRTYDMAGLVDCVRKFVAMDV